MPSNARAAIKKSFFLLAEKKPVDKITVKDIVEDCGINRNSFYYHFEDLPSLIRVSIEEEVEKMVCMRSDPALEEVLLDLADFLIAHRQACLNVYQSRHRDLLEKNFLSACEKLVRLYFERSLFQDYDLRLQDQQTIIYYYKVLLFGLLSDWLNASMSYDIKDRIRKIIFLRMNMAQEMAQRCMLSSLN